MITRIKVENFKSLEKFEIENLSLFTCFIGLNGAGKTTLFQFFDFVRALLLGRVQEWFDRYKWSSSDIITLGKTKRSIEFEFDIKNLERTVTWIARFNIQEMRCVYEKMVAIDNRKTTQLFLYEDNKLKIFENDYPLPPNFKQEGSICSFMDPLPGGLDELLNTKFFGVLDPSAISQATQTNKKTTSIEVENNGKGLTGFISKLKPEFQKDLFERLQVFYPSARDCKIKNRTYGWKNLLIAEIEKAYFDASHLSYGTLRLLLILSQLYSNNACVLFDEIENGINQELINKLLVQLQNFNDKQVMVTTHSALVLNYLEDAVAKDSVVLLYKDTKGFTKAVKFFEIPEIAKQMDFMAPGQIMSQTNLIELSEKLKAQGDLK